MDTNRQEDPLSSAGTECEGQMTQDDETQMTDDDQTQMSESDVIHNKYAASQIIPNTRGRRRMRISSESDEHMGESSQQFDLDPNLGNLGQEDAISHTQETDSGSVEAESQIFDNPVTKAFEKTRQSCHSMHISDLDSDSDSAGPESGDDMSQA